MMYDISKIATSFIIICSCLLGIKVYSQSNGGAKGPELYRTPVSYYMSFDNPDFFKEDFIEQSGKKSIAERKIDFPGGKFGKGIRMSFIPAPPDANNMSGIDLDLITAVLFNTHPGNTMGYNQPFIWGSGRVSPRLGAVAFWAKGEIAFPGPLFEQTTISFGRKERDLIGILTNSENKISAYLRDARYVRHELNSEAVWDPSVWNHVVLNWDWANGMELWLNGRKIASSWGEDGWFETAPPGLFHLPAPGMIYDELYLMDRPLSDREIARLMSSNTPPKNESLTYVRKDPDSKRLARYSGADRSENLPVISPDRPLSFSEVWPADVADGKVPGWHVIDGRNEMAWPHDYAYFTIIPGDGDFHAEKVDIKTSPESTVNYITLTGNLTNVKVQSGRDEMRNKEDLFKAPDNNGFFYGSMITATEGSTFRIPFTEKYGAPSDFNGDLRLPLSGEKRIQEVGLYHVTSAPYSTNSPKGDKLVLSFTKPELDKRTQFAMRALTSRDERKVATAARSTTGKQKSVADIGAFSRLNILSEPYSKPQGITGLTLSLPIKTNKPEEVLFIRVRDPGVPSRLWNQFAVKLSGFDKGYRRLALTIDFHDIVVAKGDRLWIDLGTVDKTEVLIGDPTNEAALFVSSVASYICLDAYAEKEIIPGKAQYSKQYEFMPWQFTNERVDIDDPSCYGGSYDMLLPALAIHRVKPDDFVANFLIAMSGPDFKDGNRRKPLTAPLITLTDPFRAPDWAVYMRDYNKKRWAIVDWWLKQQNPDGQIGGGWNDDAMFGNMGFEDLLQDGNYSLLDFINAIQTKLELTGLFRNGFCNIYPIDRLHIGDFISERYKTIVHNLGQAYAAEREMESAWRLGKPEKTPINYYAEGFKSSVNVLNWYWGKDVPDAPYISKPIDSLTQRLRLFASVLDSNSFYRLTAARVMTDDFLPYGSEWSGEDNIYAYMLGGARGARVDAHPRLSVGWPSGGGPDMARLVLRADDNSLHALAYSFGNKLHNLDMRLFRINDGRYKIALYEDPGNNGNGGAEIWSVVKDLSRFDVVTLPVPPRKSLVIRVEKMQSNSRPSELPDLAIDPWDAIWSNNTVNATIHNLGNDKVENLRVRLLDGEKPIADRVINRLNAPTDFVAKRANVSFDNIPFSSNLKIIIDPDGQVREILKENNSARVVPSDFQSKDPIIWNVYRNKFDEAWLELRKHGYGNDSDNSSNAFSVNSKN